MFGKKENNSTICKHCNTECYTKEKLDRHKAIAHQQHDTTRESRRAIAKGRGQFG